MNNFEIADVFSMLAKIMDLHGENAFKVKTYSIAAYNIEKITQPLAALDEATLFATKGIGESIGRKIQEIIQTGKLQALEDLIDKTPQGVLEIMSIKGLGPKKVAIIWKEMGIESVGELEYACHENRLAAYKGFGGKTQQRILDNIAFINSNKGFHLWADVHEFAETWLHQLKKRFSNARFSLTGDVRRQSITLECIEIITDLKKTELLAAFQSSPSVSIEIIDDKPLIINILNCPKLKIYFSSNEQFFRELFNTTGSEQFVAPLIKSVDLNINFDSEEAIFEHIGISFIPPYLREDIEITEIPIDINAIIQPNSIRGIIHSHSNWSDGLHSIEEMALAAKAQGFEYLVLSDHSQAAYYAKGLTPERIAAQHIEIDVLNIKLAPFKIFKSIEADILNDGQLDYSDNVLAQFDLVIASVHSNLKMTEEKAMQRILTAIQIPFTSILGHPSGRLLLSRKEYPIDYKTIIDACKKHQVVIEINAHPKRLDLDWAWINYAQEMGVLLSINPDAHTIEGYKDVFFGAMAAQKGGLMTCNNLSSYSLAEMEQFIAKNKEKIKSHL